MRTAFVVIVSCAVVQVFAQGLGVGFYNRNSITTKIIDKNIKTVKVCVTGMEISYPVINIHSGQSLEISFDEMVAESKNYSYRVVHCDANWVPSRLMRIEYARGFDEVSIRNNDQSHNTTTDYNHYSFTFPSDEQRALLTGNYLIEVIDEDDKNRMLFTTRVMVVDHVVRLQATAGRSSNVEVMDVAQEVVFSIALAGLNVRDPFADIKVAVLQNGRWDNAVTGLKPSFTNNDELTYIIDKESNFAAGNEFRRFDFKMFKHPAENVKAFEMRNGWRQVVLNDDEPRRFIQYFDRGDLNGKYAVANSLGENSDLDADYAMVNFTLKYPVPEVLGDIYVFGELTNWELSGASKMVYDIENMSYTASLPLKQGFYDYQYVFLDTLAHTLDYTFIENSHWETENDYLIIVYHGDEVVGYDRIVGYGLLNSRKK